MRNLTVCISDDTYRQARIWAAKRDTSVTAMVTDLLEDLPAMWGKYCSSTESKPPLTGPKTPQSGSN